MSVIETVKAVTPVTADDLEQMVQRLSAEFDGRAPVHDADDSFVAENFSRLREEGLLAAAVPKELGGMGLEMRDLAGMLRILGQGCGSTALAFAMHTHSVAMPAWRWRHQPQAKAAVEPLLKRVAADGAVVVTSGGSDWVGGSGRAERVDGGYRIHARKIFASSSPSGALLNTTAVAGDKVIHFSVPMSAPEVRMLDNWRTLGMRGTGSQDIQIDGFFVPDDKVALTRNAGEWHAIWQIIAVTAMPLIYAVYLGVAEAAAGIALGLARQREGASRNPCVVGEMELALRAARWSHQAMLAEAERNTPGPETVAEVMLGRKLVERHAIATVDAAMELAGGQGFYRATGLERRFRDVQGARYHPMKRDSLFRYAGSVALGDPVDRIF